MSFESGRPGPPEGRLRAFIRGFLVLPLCPEARRLVVICRGVIARCARRLLRGAIPRGLFGLLALHPEAGGPDAVPPTVALGLREVHRYGVFILWNVMGKLLLAPGVGD